MHSPSAFFALRQVLFSLVLTIPVIFSPSLQAQTEPHWEDYIIFGAGFMGPNSLPIPRTPKGRVENINMAMVTGVANLSPGDKTYNPATFAYFTLVEDLVSFDYYMVPVEYFVMSEAIKDERNVFVAFEDEHFAIGDVYLNSNVQVFNRPKFHAAVRAGFKIPSSGMVGAARFTDSPGYNLDASFGSYLVQREGLELELFGMGGFYSYQTQGGYVNYRQNDALLFGLGLGLKLRDWQIDNVVRGYLGYFDLRDKPIVYRLNATRDFGNIRLLAALQVGLNDFDYVSPEIGIGYLFPAVNIAQRVSK